MPEDPHESLEGEAAISLWLKTLNRKDDDPHHWNAWVKEHPVSDVTFAWVDFGALRSEVPNEIVSFAGFHFPTGRVSFVDAKFGAGRVDFKGTNFGDGPVSFFGAKFDDGDVSFGGAEFGEGDVDFFSVAFGDGTISFKKATFGKGKANFRNLKPIDDEKGRKGDVCFEGAEFDGDTTFAMARFGEGVVNFSKCVFGKGTVDFSHTDFGEGAASFVRTQFGDGEVSFQSATFRNGRKEKGEKKSNKGHVLFNGAVFGVGNIRFDRANFGSSGPPMCIGKISIEEEQDYMNVLFRRTTFGAGDVDFNIARFGNGITDFEDATFGVGNVSFIGTTFGSGDIKFLFNRFAGRFTFMPARLSAPGPLHFKHCTFSARFELTRSDENDPWEKPISFEGSAFNGATVIKKVLFVDVPDFRSTAFTHHLAMDEIDYAPNSQFHKWRGLTLWLKRPPHSENSSKVKRLKDLAEQSNSHQLALKLRADELRTRRWNETTTFMSLVDALYDEFCDYGQSISRPTRYLLLNTVLFALIYLLSSSKLEAKSNLFDYLLFSFTNSIPFLGVSRDVRIFSLDRLFNDGDLSAGLYALLSAQGLIAAILLFLIGLGLRNHFRI